MAEEQVIEGAEGAAEAEADSRPNIDHLSGPQRAAIVMAVFGEEIAEQMLPHFSKRDVARIAKEMADMGSIEPEIADTVLEEYYLAAMKPPGARGGPELARKLLSAAEISENLVDKLLGPELAPGEELLGPLLETPPPSLARALQEEHPQTAALVLLHLPANKAAETLRAMPEQARSETVLRMATLREVKGEVLGDVASSLNARLDEKSGSKEPTDGIGRTASVLTQLGRAEMKSILEALEPDHPDEAEALSGQVFTFDSLMDVDDRGMQELLRQADTQRLALALKGANEDLSERFLANLSERASAMLREEIEFLATVNPDEQAAARKEIIDIALKLEADGNLVFQESDTEAA
ncbi:hypothetical protein ABI59_14495 [Acidobacteria bacterium Mor1]|nr:hypothetical protein ABI59_14495 [Acidobacteria bacterium Mor1]